MITRKVSTMGFELQVLVPATNDEYNGLAPKRVNPVLEDAVLNIIYRGVLNKFRDKFLDELGKLDIADQSGAVVKIARINHGTEDEPQWEKDSVYFKRFLATVATRRGLDPAAEATKTVLMSELTPLAQKTIDAVKFDPTAEERTGGNLIAKTYLEWAQIAVKKGYDANDKGSAAWLNVRLVKALNTEPVTFKDGDDEGNVKLLAKQIAANEKRKRDLQAAESKAEYAIDESPATS